MKVLKKLLSGIREYISGDTPTKGSVYACTTGDYLGEFFVYVDSDDTHYTFLSLPKMEERKVPFAKFTHAINNSILERVEKLPDDVANICEGQYIQNR